MAAIWCQLLTGFLLFLSASGQFDFGQSATGEREGELSPAAIAGVTVGVLAGVAALAVTIFFCYYVYTKQKRAMDVSNDFAIRKY